MRLEAGTALNPPEVRCSKSDLSHTNGRARRRTETENRNQGVYGECQCETDAGGAAYSTVLCMIGDGCIQYAQRP
jgi:hypothetical protein